MQYKTIMLALLQKYPTLHRELRTAGTLLSTLNRTASELKDRHTCWIDALRQQQPQNAPEQIASAALEIAMQEMREALLAAVPPTIPLPEAFSLDAAMTLLRQPTPPA